MNNSTPEADATEKKELKVLLTWTPPRPISEAKKLYTKSYLTKINGVPCLFQWTDRIEVDKVLRPIQKSFRLFSYTFSMSWSIKEEKPRLVGQWCIVAPQPRDDGKFSNILSGYVGEPINPEWFVEIPEAFFDHDGYVVSENGYGFGGVSKPGAQQCAAGGGGSLYDNIMGKASKPKKTRTRKPSKKTKSTKKGRR